MKVYRNILTSLILIVITVFTLQSQELPEIKKNDLDKQKTGFEKAWLDLQEGIKLYTEGPGTYKEAVQFFLNVHDVFPYQPAVNYMIGVCYLYSDNQKKALPFLKAAIEFDPNISGDIHYMLGQAYHYNYEFTEAADSYEAYLAGLDKKELNKVDTLSVQILIKQCATGNELINDTTNVHIINLGSKINSEWDDYLPVFTSNGDRLFFTSRRQFAPDQKRNILDNKFNEDIYVSMLSGDSIWEPAQYLGKPVNTKLNDAAIFLPSSGDTLYIYRGAKGGGEFMFTVQSDGVWGNPGRLSTGIRSGGHESTMTLTHDGKMMFFVSDRKDDNYGKLDIYRSELDAKGKWMEPVNVGSEVNSPYNEEGVFISPDGQTLYFSNDGPGSMGGYDVFMSVLDSGRWTTPVNLGYPINSPADDIFYVRRDSLTAYYSSIRDEGNGLMDLYKIIYIPDVPEPEPEPIPEEVPVVIVPVVLPDPTFELHGTITDADDSTFLMARLEIIDMDENKVIATTISSRTSGLYSITLKKKPVYGVEVEASGYMFFLDLLETSEESSLDEIRKDFSLKKIKVGEKIVLKHIYFEFNRSTLTVESHTELDRVVNFLNNNPELRIEVSGHTDNIGTASVNQNLSENRAKAVVEYLNQKGIDQTRLEYAGFGFSQPISSNDTEEGRAQNRRVEFKIVE